MKKTVLSFLILLVVSFADELKKAPAFSARDTKGKLVNSQKLYSQKVTMIFFWHSCCGMDKDQLAILKDFYTTHSTNGLEIVGVALDGVKKSAAVKKACAKFDMDWISVVDKSKAIKSKFNPIMLPTLYIINSKGEIVDYFSGYKAEYKEQQQAIIDKLLQD